MRLQDLDDSRLNEDRLAEDRLGMFSVVFFVVSSAAPLTVVAGLVSTGWAVTGVAGLPLAFVLVAAVLAVFCVGYVAVSARVRNAGAFTAYIASGLGRPLGVAAAFIAVPSYFLLQVGAYGALGPAASALVEEWTGIPVAWWIPALCAWVLIAVLGVHRVDVNGKVLAVALLAEVCLVVVYDCVDMAHPHGGTVSTATLSPSSLSGGGIGAALAIAVTGFVGFESAAVFSEESRRHTRTVKTATYTALGAMTVLYAGSAWAMSVALGPENLVAAAREHGTDLPFFVAAAHLGSDIAIHTGHVLFITSLFAASLAFHNTAARYLFAIGREHVLPQWFAVTSCRTGAPKHASMTQSGIALAVILTYAITGTDPLVKLFFWGGTTGAFGILILVAVTSFAVIGFFHRHPDLKETPWRALWAPLLSGTALTGITTLIITNYAQMLGVEPSSPLRWALPSIFPLLGVTGVLWALYLRARHPSTYASIGAATHLDQAMGLTLIHDPATPDPDTSMENLW
jgi:amino acid transporter